VQQERHVGSEVLIVLVGYLSQQAQRKLRPERRATGFQVAAYQTS
jgi:hypothetical protein